MSGKIRLIQVGLGGWGRNWYQEILSGFPGIEIAAWVDAAPRALTAARSELGIPRESCFTELAEALKTVECDAVLVTASLPGHMPSALAALKAGKHVLVEKPFAPSNAEANRMVAAAEKSGKVLAVSQNYRFFPAPILARRIVEGGTLGKLGVITIDFRRDNVVHNSGMTRHEKLPNPLLADMAIHHFDLMRMMTGSDARKISCTTWNPPWSKYVDPPAGAATIEMKNGVVVSYRGSWVSPARKTAWAGEWSMEFERGVVAWTSRQDRASGDALEIRPYGGKAKTPRLPVVKHLDRAGSLAAFLEAVRGRIPAGKLEISGANNRGSLGLTYAAIESAAKGKPVELPQSK